MFRQNRAPQIPTDELFISAYGLSVEVGNERPLDTVSLLISPGEHVAISGPSGSGKTTLANYLLGMSINDRPPAAGGVYYNNTSIYDDLNKQQRTTLRGTLFGYVPQAANLIPGMTVEDNITINARMKKLPVDRFNMWKLIFAMGISGKMGQEAGTLSGGEQQRVSIVRALAHRPAAVILDEPTAALHKELKHEVNGLLADLSEETGTTIVVISHEETSADRIINLDSGRIIGDAGLPFEQEGIL